MLDHLTPRQARERAFHDVLAREIPAAVVVDDPVVVNPTGRPWNPGWRAYGVLAEAHRSGARNALDVGCGRGETAVRLARLGYTVTGLDVSPASLASAAAVAAAAGVASRVRFVEGVAEALPFADGSFDAVAGFDVLHHTEVAPTVSECLRVLRPGGTAVFKEWIDVPAIDRLIAPLRWLTRRHPEVTADERKLTAADLATIVSLCPSTTVIRFRLLARLHRITKPAEGQPSRLEQMDAVLFRMFPFVRWLGGSSVIVLRKPQKSVR